MWLRATVSDKLLHITVVCSICGSDILSCGIWWAWLLMNIFRWCDCLGKRMWVKLLEHESLLSIVELETCPDAAVKFFMNKIGYYVPSEMYRCVLSLLLSCNWLPKSLQPYPHNEWDFTHDCLGLNLISERHTGLWNTWWAWSHLLWWCECIEYLAVNLFLKPGSLFVFLKSSFLILIRISETQIVDALLIWR